MGKISIIQQAYSEAYVYLDLCLKIKKDLFRYKPQGREIIKVHRLI